jgi:hypothetical protein
MYGRGRRRRILAAEWRPHKKSGGAEAPPPDLKPEWVQPYRLPPSVGW